MTTPEDELEAAIWRAMTDACITCPDPLGFIVDIQLAARRYAAGDSELVTAERRRVLHRDAAEQTSPSDCGGDGGAAPELHPSGSAASRRLSTAVGGATLSTGRDVPGAGKSSGKSYPQPVDKP